MSLYLPEELRWLGWIAGAEWPDGDEDNAWAVSAAWKDAANELLALLAAVDEVEEATMAAYPEGAARVEMGAQFDRLRTGDSSLEALGNYMLETADSTFDFGTELQSQKLTIIITLCWLAIEIALAWLFPPTAPAVEAAAIGTTRATLQAVATSVQRAIQNLAAKLGAPNIQRSFWKSLLAGKPVMPTAKGWGSVGSEVIQGAAEEALINGAIQAGQLADGKRDEFNGEEFGYSVAAGGAAEPVGSGIAKGLNKGIGNGFGFSKGFGAGLDNWWGRVGRNTVVGAAADGGAGIFGSLFVSAISGQSVEDTLTGIGVAGGFIQGGIVGAADPSSFGFGPSGFAGSGSPFGRGGPRFAGGSGDGSVPGAQNTGENAGMSEDGPRSPAGSETYGSGQERSGGPRIVPTGRTSFTPSGLYGSSTGTQHFSGGQQPDGFGGQHSDPTDFSGSNPYEPGNGNNERPTAPEISPTGGRSPQQPPAPAPVDSGATGGAGSDGRTRPSDPGAGGDDRAAASVGGDGPTNGDRGADGSTGKNGGASSGNDSGESASGERGHTGDEGGHRSPESAPDPLGGKGSDPATASGENTANHGDRHGDASWISGSEKPGEPGQRPDQPGSRAGESAAGQRPGDRGETGGRFGQEPIVGGQQSSVPPAAPVTGPVQPAAAPQSTVPGQSAGPTQPAPSTQPGRTEAPAGQSSSAGNRPGTSSSAAPTGTPAGLAAGDSAPASTTSAAGADSTPAAGPISGRDGLPTGTDPGPAPGSDEDAWANLADIQHSDDADSRWTRTEFQTSVIDGEDTVPLIEPGMPSPARVPGSLLPQSPASASPTPAQPPLNPAQPAQQPGSPTQNSPPSNQGGQQSTADSDAGRPKRSHAETESEAEPPPKKPRTEHAVPDPEQHAVPDPEQPAVPPPAASESQQTPPVAPVPLTVGPQTAPPPPRSRRPSPAQTHRGPVTAQVPLPQQGPSIPNRVLPQVGPVQPSSTAAPAAGPPPPGRRRPPPPMLLTNPSNTRVYGPGLLAPLEDPQSQRNLEDVLRDEDGNFIRFADPRTHPAGGTPYGRLINPGGPATLGRGNNCPDCAMSALATFLGRPEVAVPRYPDMVDGVVDTLRQEPKALQRVFHMLRTYPDSYRDGRRTIPEQFAAIHDWMTHLGEGSAAFVNSEWHRIDPATGASPVAGGRPGTSYAHATVIVYPKGAAGPVWWDPQTGAISDGPPQHMVRNTAKIDFIPIPPGRSMVADPPAAQPPAPAVHRPPPGPVSPPVRTVPEPPMRLPDPAATRTFGPGRLDPVEHPGLQKVLADVLRAGSGNFVVGADPRTYPTSENPYGRMINAGGPALPGRTTNRFDAAISALSSFLGSPQVAAPRHADGGPGLYVQTDEPQGYLRAAQWLGTGPNHFDPALPVPQQFTHLHNWVHHLGPGAAALAFRVVPEIDPRTGTIARDPQHRPVTGMQPLVVVYPPSADGPVWWDPVTGETWDRPPASAVATTARLGFLSIPPGRTVDPPAVPHAPSPGGSAAGEAPHSPAGAGDRRGDPTADGSFEPLRDPIGNPEQDTAFTSLPEVVASERPGFTQEPVEFAPVPEVVISDARDRSESPEPVELDAVPETVMPHASVESETPVQPDEYTPLPEAVMTPAPAAREIPPARRPEPGVAELPATDPAAQQPPPSPEFDEGYIGVDGYRQFTDDESGNRYGENRLGVFHDLPAEQQNATRKYVAESFTVNNVLRDGNPDRAEFFTRVRDSLPTLITLYDLNGGDAPTRADLERIAQNPDLSPEQRAVVDQVLGRPDVEAHLEQLDADQDTLSRLTAYLGTAPTQAAFDRRITDLDAAVDRPIPGGPLRAVRGMNDISFLTASDGAPLGGRDPRLLVGTTQQEPAYLSTSLGKVPAFPGTVRIELDLPAGTRGLWLGRNGRYAYERELLLARGTVYQITEVVPNPTGDYGNIRPEYLIRAVVLPPAAAPGPASGATEQDARSAPVPKTISDGPQEGGYVGLIPVSSDVVMVEGSDGLIPVALEAPPERSRDGPGSPVPDVAAAGVESAGLIPVMSSDVLMERDSDGLITVAPEAPGRRVPSGASPLRPRGTATESDGSGHRQPEVVERHELPGEDQGGTRSGGEFRYELPGDDQRHELPGSGQRHVPARGEQRHELPGSEQISPAMDSDIELPDRGPEDPPAENTRLVTDPAAPSASEQTGPQPVPAATGHAGAERPLSEPEQAEPAAKKPKWDGAQQVPVGPRVPHPGPGLGNRSPVPPPHPGAQQDVSPRPRLDRPWPPPLLADASDARMFGPGWLAPLENPALQQDLDDAMRDSGGKVVRYADPRNHPAGERAYGEMINPGGTTAPGRDKNCLDCVISGLLTFLGKPKVALPRYHRIVNGVVDTVGGDGLDQFRLHRMLGNQPNDFNDGTRTIPQQFAALQDYVTNLGEGSAAYVQIVYQARDPLTDRPLSVNGQPVLGSHATLIVYPAGAPGPVWWDPQGNIASERPTLRLTRSTVMMRFIPVPPGTTVLDDLPAAQPSARPEVPVPRHPVREPVLAPVPTRPDPPPRLANPSESRRIGKGGLRAVEHPGFQKALEDALRGADGKFVAGADPRTFPRPEYPYAQMINPGGTALRGRDTNRFDAALSALATFLGKPEVAVPRQPDPAIPGNDRADETGGKDRAVQWLHSDPTGFDSALPILRQYEALQNWMTHLGPGSAALVLPVKPRPDPQTGAPLRAPDGGVVLGDPEPLVVVHPPMASGPVWWDPVTGETWDAPPPTLVASTAELAFVPIPAGRTVGDPAGNPGTTQVAGTAAGGRADTGMSLGAPAGNSPTASGSRGPVQSRPARNGTRSGNTHSTGTSFRLRERLRQLLGPRPARPGPGPSDPVPAAPSYRTLPPPVPAPAVPTANLPGAPGPPSPGHPPPAPRHGRRQPPVQVLDPTRSRVFGTGHMAPLESPEAQRALDQAMRDRDGNIVVNADPRVHPAGGPPYGELINAGGKSVPGRDTNCVDCTLAALSTFLGHPVVAAPSYFRVVDGVVSSTYGENGGLERAVHMFRTEFDDYAHDGRSIPEQLAAIGAWIEHLGPGSAAFVTNEWYARHPVTDAPLHNADGSPKTAGGHAIAIVYPPGADRPVWWDPQSGEMSSDPPVGMATRSASVQFLPISPGRTVVTEPANGNPTLPAPATAARPLPATRPRRRRPAAMLLADPTDGRRFERYHLDRLEHPGHQKALEDALRDSHGNFVTGADPRSYPTPELPYGMLVNAGGPTTPMRRYNRVDAALAGLSSFLGKPQVAVPCHPDSGLGVHNQDDEGGAIHRLQYWGRNSLGRFGSEAGPESAHFGALHDWVDALGPGSAAVAVIELGTVDPRSGQLVSSFDDETEMLLVVYPVDAAGPVWWNPVTGQTWDAPPAHAFPEAVDFRFLEIPPGRRISDTPFAQKDMGPLVRPEIDPPQPPLRLADPSADRDPFFDPVDPAARQALEDALRDSRGNYVTAADPRTYPTLGNPYRTLVEVTDPAAPAFGLNKFDAAMAAVSSFLGTPLVAAPRQPSAGADDEDMGAGDGIDRLLGWTKTELNAFPEKSVAAQFAALHDWVASLGPGAAVVAVSVTVEVDPKTGTFDRALPEDQLTITGAAAPVVVFPKGATQPVWWDPVTGEVSESPPPALIQRTLYLNFVAIPPGRTVATAAATRTSTRSGPAQAVAGGPNLDHTSEGVRDESTVTERGSSTELRPGSSAGGSPVPDRPDAGGRLAAPAGDDRGGLGDRPGRRDVVSGGARGDRRDPAVSELVGFDGAGGLHGGGDHRPGTGGTADLSAPDQGRTAADRRDRGADRVPDQRPLGGEAGGGILDGDRQGDTPATTDEHRRDGGGVLGGLASGAGRGMAGDGDDGVLKPGPGRRLYHGHGRPQRRRPVEWSLPTDFRAPDAADMTWLPPGATTAGPDHHPGPAPEEDKPFTL
ncbi:toxin glutamine deamidase domain-containing protein [Nocardia sp. NPDC050799]|uniref:toxin glutamine deamidase domain-containing protein n=1 Tax=Nocardia sp. NPDC050799 TaxID=3154842 RepID=UPI0033CF941A